MGNQKKAQILKVAIGISFATIVCFVVGQSDQF